MFPLQYSNMRIAYRELCQGVVTLGQEAAPRGLKTREIRGVTFEVNDPTDMLAIGTGRKLNTRWAAADAIQVIGGFTDHEWGSQFNPRIAEYGEHGAYGPRIGWQMQAAIDRLGNEDTRRAVVQIWNPDSDLMYDEAATDYPCTTEFQFLVRDGRLEQHVTMRSNDVWFGVPYDVFTFSQLQLTVANVLGIPAGSYYHHAVSFHAYEKDWEAIAGLEYNPGPARENRPMGLGERGWSWEQVMNQCRALAYFPDEVALAGLRDRERWWAEKLVA